MIWGFWRRAYHKVGGIRDAGIVIICANLVWNAGRNFFVYKIERDEAKEKRTGRPKEVRIGWRSEVKNTKNAVRVVGIALLGLFVVVVGVPLLLTAAGVTLSIVGTITMVAVGLIKLAVVLAVVYLVLVGISALLR
jgi:sterol desaturase/sphingolipid hydroxylase (fatty acid hydroxylase superfamily)